MASLLCSVSVETFSCYSKISILNIGCYCVFDHKKEKQKHKQFVFLMAYSGATVEAHQHVAHEQTYKWKHLLIISTNIYYIITHLRRQKRPAVWSTKKLKCHASGWLPEDSQISTSSALSRPRTDSAAASRHHPQLQKL